MLIKKKELKPVAVFNDVEMFLQSDTFEGSEYLASAVKDFQRIRIDTDDEHVERFYDTPEGINAVLTQQYAIPTKPRFCALTGPIRIYKIEHLTSLWNEVK
ncbi:hypothetical protein FD12_GL001564 [Lentilactobacillus rapi DSM 19907 = JCM 15042]|nr:hypothetical protein FD12_GL001564 [Lentilactobacillus rapi DSM 19907 = JCM 15042]KRN27168.1 hypothetical protein IV38_GL000744 [Lactobacillus selangorensis]